MAETRQLNLIVVTIHLSLFNRNTVRPLVPSNYFFVINQCGSVPCPNKPLDTLAFIFPNSHFPDNCLMVSIASSHSLVMARTGKCCTKIALLHYSKSLFTSVILIFPLIIYWEMLQSLVYHENLIYLSCRLSLLKFMFMHTLLSMIQPTFLYILCPWMKWFHIYIFI